MRLLLSILTQWHYSVFKTKIYLPRKCLSNSQEGHTVITWRVQSRRVKTSIRPSLGTFHCQLSHCKVSIVHQTSVPYSFLLWPLNIENKTACCALNIFTHHISAWLPAAPRIHFKTLWGLWCREWPGHTNRTRQLWSDVTSHPASLLIYLLKSEKLILSSQVPLKTLLAYWYIHVNVEINVILNPDFFMFWCLLNI